MIDIFLKMTPPTVTQQEHKVTVRGGKPRFYDSAKLKSARSLFESALAMVKPVLPMEGPVELFVEWKFPTKSHKEGAYRVTRPDTDNLQKLLKDCMTKTGFWKDDAQVCRELVVKRWCRKEPGIHIMAGEIHDEE